MLKYGRILNGEFKWVTFAMFQGKHNFITIYVSIIYSNSQTTIHHSKGWRHLNPICSNFRITLYVILCTWIGGFVQLGDNILKIEHSSFEPNLIVGGRCLRLMVNWFSSLKMTMKQSSSSKP